MNELEKLLLAEALGTQDALLCLRTGTTVDAGCWWHRAPVWLCVTQAELILLAVARRRFLKRVPRQDCSGSLYCHGTGALILAPVKGLETNRLDLSPAQALRVLRVLTKPCNPENE